MPRGELTCRELVELVSDYLDDVLAPEERVRFDDHVASCEGCELYVDQFRATIELVGVLEPEHVSEAAYADLVAAFRGWRAHPGEPA